MDSKSVRKALDKKLQALPGLLNLHRPHKGWIRAVRDALGMTSTQMAARMGVSQPRISALEKQEIEESLTLATLRKSAAALDCALVYAFVPKSSFEETLKVRARIIASQLIGKVDHTMALESQNLEEGALAEEIEALAEELIRTKERIIWSDRS